MKRKELEDAAKKFFKQHTINIPLDQDKEYWFYRNLIYQRDLEKG